VLLALLFWLFQWIEGGSELDEFGLVQIIPTIQLILRNSQ